MAIQFKAVIVASLLVITALKPVVVTLITPTDTLWGTDVIGLITILGICENALLNTTALVIATLADGVIVTCPDWIIGKLLFITVNSVSILDSRSFMLESENEGVHYCGRL